VAGPSWLAGVFAAAMILSAGYAAIRLATSRLLRMATEADTDGLHTLMGTAMAGMFLPQLHLLPNSAWAVLFGTWAVWFAASALHARGTAGRRWRCRFPVPHLVECIAMVYMLLALPTAQRGPGMAMPGMGPSPGAAAGFPALALVLALFVLGYILWTADQLAARARAKTTLAAPPRTPHRALVTIPAPAPSRLATLASAIDTPHTAETSPPHPAAGHPLLAPQFADFSKIVMSITMGYMLITMV
jgi:Domain of unknown function (DUF5134)